MFAEDAFGGGWFHGVAVGPGAEALEPCDGGNPGDHARLRAELEPLLGQCPGVDLAELGQQVPLLESVRSGGGALISEFIGAVPGTLGDTGSHGNRTLGWPNFEHWPRWDAIAHQQSWEGHLREAYDEGLRVVVVSAVTFDFLCLAAAPENVEHPECDEMADIRRQLVAASEFDAANDWVEIALTPADTRRIVGEGRLALVLSVEASHIMSEGDWRPQLDELYALGVRTLQPVHQLDNRFGGASPHNPIFHLAQFAESCHIDEDCGLSSSALTLGFDVDAACRNVKGLTDEGRELVEAMMDRGMLVDAAHLSEASVRDLYELSVARDYYPFYLSHAHFREIMLPEKQLEEKTTPAWVVGMVRETGGMIGLRTAHEEVNTYTGASTPNSCHGSSRSFAQAYEFGLYELKVAMGLGSDMNGFIQQTRPRFGPDACSGSFEEERRCQARDERNAGPAGLGTAFDEIGLGHMGVLVDVLDDLDLLGTDTAPLRRSADDFVRMWERATDPRSGPADAIDDLSVAGVEVLPPHATRRAEFPAECNVRYCPASLAAGEACRFAAECESGSCVGAGTCGNPRGTCE
jgi:microsomal dipeptidase-like Zn-dependent dipeptidase